MTFETWMKKTFEIMTLTGFSRFTISTKEFHEYMEAAWKAGAASARQEDTTFNLKERT